jgi:hypothetical protein
MVTTHRGSRLGAVVAALLATLSSVAAATPVADALTPPAPPFEYPAVVRDDVWHLRGSLSTGTADQSFVYGDGKEYNAVLQR